MRRLLLTFTIWSCVSAAAFAADKPRNIIFNLINVPAYQDQIAKFQR
jgi:hypothetical protein